jgi:hypothetical protein
MMMMIMIMIMLMMVARAVKHTSASFPALFSCLAPFFTGFLAFLVLGETLGRPTDIVGLVLNIVGERSVPQSRRPRWRYQGPGGSSVHTFSSIKSRDGRDIPHGCVSGMDAPAVWISGLPSNRSSVCMARSGDGGVFEAI